MLGEYCRGMTPARPLAVCATFLLACGHTAAGIARPGMSGTTLSQPCSNTLREHSLPAYVDLFACTGSLASDLLQFAESFSTPVGTCASEWTSGSAATVCQWYGVLCNQGNSSFALDLGSQALAGTLGSDWFDLPSFDGLTALNLSNNQVTSAAASFPSIDSGCGLRPDAPADWHTPSILGKLDDIGTARAVSQFQPPDRCAAPGLQMVAVALL